jgi:peptidoglycan/LPS O-acetylase OafA/YrhL
MPGLDGLRALAVAAVIAYHLGYGWASGGLLGVGVFFTLSGYLITELLVSDRATGRRRMRDFWLARARRLLPALFAMLAVVSIWVWLDDRAQLSMVRGQTLAALVYVSNWWQSFQHLSYFSRFGPPSPLNHLWSLSVEEQFYLLWPWLLLLGVHAVRERRAGALRPRLAVLTLMLAVGSSLEMVLLFHPSFDPSRVYYGTDTRAFGLLLGAALALVWPSQSLSGRVGPHAGDILDAAGVLGMVGIGVLIWRTNEYAAFLYRGGLVLLSLCTVIIIAALTHPAARLGRLLGARPLRWLGVRSYGIYLWQLPVIALTTPEFSRGVQPLRAGFQVAAIVALAALSWRYLENPIRHGALGRIRAQAREVHWNPWRLEPRWRLASVGAAAAAALACVGLSGVLSSPALKPVLDASEIPSAVVAANARPVSSSNRNAALPVHRPQPPGAPTGHTPASTRRTTAPSPQSSRRAGTTPPTGSSPTAAARNRRAALETSCRSVVHIGDSTSEGMISNDYLPDPSQQLPAQYARVGVRRSIMKITGATSIVETLPGGTNAHRVAQGLAVGGYHGCWVIALGTNDAADIYVGSAVSLRQRIRELMSVIGNQPVLWVNAKTLLLTGPYSESNMRQWNQALVSACAAYPQMRVYDWASAAETRWFIPDGIHYYSPGYAARAHLIADALATAFPAHAAASPSCVVSTPSISLPVLGVH